MDKLAGKGMGAEGAVRRRNGRAHAKERTWQVCSGHQKAIPTAGAEPDVEGQEMTLGQRQRSDCMGSHDP